MILAPESIMAMKTPAHTARRCGITELVRVCVVAAVAMASSIGPAQASAQTISNESTRHLATGGGALSSTAKVAAPITDAAGRIRYIVDLVDNDAGKPAQFADAASKIDYSKTNSAQLIDEVTKPQGVEVLGTTSLVGTSFTAYLTPAQVDQFSKDIRVKLITQDAYLEPSALWNSSTDASGQVRPWGLEAMGVTQAGSSNGSAMVYVLDTGVEMHADLPGLSVADRYTALPGIYPTGCYAHATHVAGIIGAADNSSGVVGVLPGARLVSIALGDTNVGSCSTGYPVSAFTQGLERIYQWVLESHRVAIVNISFNGPGIFSATATIGRKMKVVATASYLDWGYPGAFIVQSAGNQLVDACGYAYNAPDAYDGIMVVGGLDDNGQRVVPLNGRGGYTNSTNPLDDEAGSNTGACVEVWAPSQRILSTWSGGDTKLLSGTSMAAPHIAGFAARLLETDPLISTSLDLELAVREYFTTVVGSNLTIPRLSLQNTTAIPTIEMGEGNSRSSIGPIIFKKFAAAVNLRYEATGAVNCYEYVTKDGSYYSERYQYPPISHNVATNSLPSGQYSWSVTCTSPQGTQNAVVANGYIKSLDWFARTTSTGGIWQQIANGTTVSWSVSANAPFDQYNVSYGTDYCHVQSYGFHGNPIGDPINPAFNYTQPYSQNLLWDSGINFPTYYQFATLNFGDPNIASPPLGPYEGYKWLLTCSNYDGDSKSTVMYGRPQP